MHGIGLEEAIAAVRSELAALEQSGDHDLAFPVEGVQLEFHVGLTRDVTASSGLKFWVVELGGDASIVREQVQRITVTLGPPVRSGETIAVARTVDGRP